MKLTSIIHRFHYRNVVIGLSNLPYLIRQKPPSFDLDVIQNARMVNNVINFWNNKFFIPPSQLIDVGANKSQVSKWLIQEWPNINIQSFEPNPDVTPIGTVHRVALSDVTCVQRLERKVDTWAHLNPYGDIEVQVYKFSEFPLEIQRPCLLKIDAENHTYRALQGFEHRINEIDMVLIEVWNSIDQINIWNWLIKHNFIGAYIVDADYSTKGWLQTDVLFYRL